MEKLIEVNEESHGNELIQHINSARKEERLCDFTIKVGSRSIPAHRIIISEGSDYFKAMLSHKMIENQSGVVEMEGVDPECTEKCIDFIYTGKLSVAIEKAEELMHVAHLLQLQKLCDRVRAILENALDPKSFFVTKSLANKFNFRELEEKCDQFALDNFEAIAQEDDFKLVEKKYLLFLIKSKRNKSSQWIRLNSIITWIKSEPSGRSKMLKELHKQINLEKVPVAHRRYLLENEPLVISCSECVLALSISVMDSLKVESFIAESEVSAEEVHSDGVPYICVFNRNSQHLQFFDPRMKTWKQMQKMTKEIMKHMMKLGFSAITLSKYIYVLMENRSVYRLKYSDEGASWEQMESMLEDHGLYPPATVMSGCIYVVGGSYLNCSKSAEKYDPSLNKWMKLSDKKTSTQNSTVTTAEGCIYNIGGWSSNGTIINTVERFDPASSTWSPVAQMNQARCRASAVELGNKIYVVGGYDGEELSTIECYDPSADTWTIVGNMVRACEDHRSFVIDGNIYSVGGWNNLGEQATSIEKYNVSNNTSEEFQMPEGMGPYMSTMITL